MIRSEHTGTGPLQLHPNASRPAPMPAAPVAQPFAALPSAAQDQALLAHAGTQGSSAPVALLEQGNPVHSRVQAAFISPGSGREEVSGVVARLRALPPQEVDGLLRLLDKQHRQVPLSTQEHARLAAVLPDMSQAPAVHRQLLRDEMTSDLRRLKVRDPENYNALIFALGDLARRPGTTVAEVEALLTSHGHALRPALRSPLLLADLPQAVRKSGAMVTPTTLRPAAPSFRPTFVRELVMPTFGDEQVRAAVARANRAAAEEVRPAPPLPEPAPEAEQQEQAEFYAHLLDVARHEPNRLSFADGDVAGLVGVLQNEGGSLGQLLDQRLRKELLGFGHGETQAPLQLENRLGYVLGQSLLRYQQPEMAGLASVLVKLENPNPTLNSVETGLLRAVGLRFHQGQLFNLGNQQVLSPEERQELAQFATLIQRYHRPDAALLAPVSGGQRMTQHEALGKALATMAQSQLLLAEVTALEQKIAANDAAIQQQNTAYQMTLDQLTIAQQQQQALLTQTEQALTQQQALTTLRQQLEAGQVPSLAQAHQILAPLGLQVTTTGYQHNGQAISQAEFLAALAAAEMAQAETVAMLQTQLAGAQRHLDQQQRQADQQGAQLQTLRDQQAADIATYQTQTTALAQTDQALGEWAAYPDLRDMLPQGAVSRLREQVQHTLQRAPQVISRAEATLARTDTLLARGRELGAVTQRLQQQQQDLQAALQTALRLREQTYQALKRKLEEEVAALVAKADQLQATLNLSPLPVGEAMAELLQAWLEDIQATAQQMHALWQQQQGLQQQERLQLSQYVEQLQRSANYHQEQLAKLDQRRSEQVATVVASALTALCPALQTLQPQVRSAQARAVGD